MIKPQHADPTCEALTAYASLQGANLKDADLQGADLQGADLQGANLQGANLQYADLQCANLQCANLEDADLRSANLWHANLRHASLQDADLRHANLRHANLQHANLRHANLQGTDLQGATLPDFQIPQNCEVIGYKRLFNGKICKLLIPTEAKRTASLRSNKCRAEFVVVLEGNGITRYNTIYRVGKTVYPDWYNDDIRLDCTNGIHFYINKEDCL
jgi:hypothetical protein